MTSHDNIWNNYLSAFSLQVIFFSFGFIICFQKKHYTPTYFSFSLIPHLNSRVLWNNWSNLSQVTEEPALFFKTSKKGMLCPQTLLLYKHLLSPPKPNGTKIFSPKNLWKKKKKRPLYIWGDGLSGSKLYFVYNDFKSLGSKVSIPFSTVSEQILVIGSQNILTRVRSKFWYVCLFKKEKNRKNDIEVFIIKQVSLSVILTTCMSM